ncbi:MAG: hypothetical protein WAS27_03975 [Candidatus Saccharimonadales bacterium]
MKVLSLNMVTSIRKAAWLFMVGVMSFVLLAQSPVQAQSAAMVNQELSAKITSMRTELERRLSSSQQALEYLKTPPFNATSESKKIITIITNSINEIKKLIAGLEGIKDINSAIEFAKTIEKQYDTYASANAAAYALNDANEQKGSLDAMKNLATDMQSTIDQAGASGDGGDGGGQQDMMKNIQQLIQTITMIVASVIALIIAIATGHTSYEELQPIIMMIVGQLTQNMTSMISVQGMFGTVLAGFSSSVGSNGTSFSMGSSVAN